MCGLTCGRMREIRRVAGAGDDDELGVGHRVGDGLGALDLDRRVGVAVDHERRHRQLAEALVDVVLARHQRRVGLAQQLRIDGAPLRLQSALPAQSGARMIPATTSRTSCGGPPGAVQASISWL